MCCLKRPFDDQIHPRVHLESEAVLWLLKQVDNGAYTLVHSEVLELENDRDPDLQRKNRTAELLGRTPISRLNDDGMLERGNELQSLGFRAMDALHIASAEQASADVFLTCDNQLLNVADRNKAQLKVSVLNPLDFIRSKDHESNTDTSGL